MRIIEIFIALILVYAILSILVSLILEWTNSRKKTRGKLLRQAIFQMLDDPLNLNYGYLLINHPLVSSMKDKTENRPFQYLDAGIFADALIDIIGEQADLGIPLNESEKSTVEESQNNELSSMESFEKGLQQMNRSPFQKMLFSLASKSDGNYVNFKNSIIEWYDSNMERTTGWYKRKQKKSLFWIGMFVAILLNIDSIHLFKVISMDDNLRNNLNIVAEGVAENYQALDPEQKQKIDIQIALIDSSLKNINTTNVDSKIIKDLKNDLNSFQKRINLSDSINELYLKQANEIMDISAQFGLPIGWSCDVAPVSWDRIPFKWFACNNENEKLEIPNSKFGQYLYNRNHNPTFWTLFLWIIGIFITGIMLSFGAPFWFELLVKFVNIRKAGLKPLSKPKSQ